MFHPETQNRHIIGALDSTVIGKVNDATTDEINYHFSRHINRTGKKTLGTHKFADKDFGLRMSFLNSNIGMTKSDQSYLLSYGFD